MRRLHGARWGLLALAAVLGFAWIQFSRSPAGAQEHTPAQGARVGLMAPDFTLSRLDGQPVSLSELRGQAVVLNFWATWCPPCRAEMPALERVYQAHREDGVVVLGVNQGETGAAVNPFLKEFGISFPVLLDAQGNVGRLYRVQALPTTYFIDRQGMIRDMVIGGPMSEALLQSKLATLLGE
ncbi:MAG: TlpA family protein disulfide reductase [Anaerolineae bacterium]|nr:TlpA family protein disulfide reductase [Anaerolineae bacterium]